MSYILVIWTVVSVTSSQYGFTTVEHRDWRPIGEFVSKQQCLNAARMLNVEARSRCVPMRSDTQ